MGLAYWSNVSWAQTLAQSQVLVSHICKQKPLSQSPFLMSLMELCGVVTMQQSRVGLCATAPLVLRAGMGALQGGKFCPALLRKYLKAKQKCDKLNIWQKLPGCLLDEVKMQEAGLTWTGHACGLPGSYIFAFGAAAAAILTYPCLCVVYCPSAFSGMGGVFLCVPVEGPFLCTLCPVIASLALCDAAQIKAVSLTG